MRRSNDIYGSSAKKLGFLLRRPFHAQLCCFACDAARACTFLFAKRVFRSQRESARALLGGVGQPQRVVRGRETGEGKVFFFVGWVDGERDQRLKELGSDRLGGFAGALGSFVSLSLFSGRLVCRLFFRRFFLAWSLGRSGRSLLLGSLGSLLGSGFSSLFSGLLLGRLLSLSGLFLGRLLSLGGFFLGRLLSLLRGLGSLGLLGGLLSLDGLGLLGGLGGGVGRHVSVVGLRESKNKFF